MSGKELIVEELVNGTSIGGLLSRPHQLHFMLVRLHAHNVDVGIPDFTDH